MIMRSPNFAIITRAVPAVSPSLTGLAAGRLDALAGSPDFAPAGAVPGGLLEAPEQVPNPRDPACARRRLAAPVSLPESGAAGRLRAATRRPSHIRSRTRPGTWPATWKPLRSGRLEPSWPRGMCGSALRPCDSMNIRRRGGGLRCRAATVV